MNKERAALKERENTHDPAFGEPKVLLRSGAGWQYISTFTLQRFGLSTTLLLTKTKHDVSDRHNDYDCQDDRQ
jgi:hypothetical protein